MVELPVKHIARDEKDLEGMWCGRVQKALRYPDASAAARSRATPLQKHPLCPACVAAVIAALQS